MICPNKCPKGQYMPTSSTCECKTCPDGQFTAEENSFPKCRTCEVCNKKDFKQANSTCKADRDTHCVCLEKYYCTDFNPEISCTHCVARLQCDPGEGAVNYGAPGNTICKPCPEGFFSNVKSYKPCFPHTNCTAVGREVKVAGTTNLDAVCGNHLCAYPAHYWMLPTGLWLGLIVSVIIAIIAAYVYWKVMRQSRRPDSASEDLIVRFSPVRAPDILPPPNELYKNKCNEAQPLNHCAVETSSISCDCTVECDGPASPMMTSPTSPMRLTPLAATCEAAGDSIVSNVCQSEPQEDEWTGA
ncbi:tumor necrosis factor receptor superfamily member 5 isoform X2 [Alosa sapidissima]|uniref:tumor necrosis factor receptor superfamily member 5 isoform X2 n=1 Tax=Alosa sapidissima TaxID=34773 RepID=UPI001C09418C|nr:tumor necrosis factor receptor superfamily member 5 isoform X2 [Alosa sapidissima]